MHRFMVVIQLEFVKLDLDKLGLEDVQVSVLNGT